MRLINGTTVMGDEDEGHSLPACRSTPLNARFQVPFSPQPIRPWISVAKQPSQDHEGKRGISPSKRDIIGGTGTTHCTLWRTHVIFPIYSDDYYIHISVVSGTIVMIVQRLGNKDAVSRMGSQTSLQPRETLLACATLN